MNFIDGEWRGAEAGGTYTRANPARTSDVIGAFPESTEVDAGGAVAAAGRAYAGWRDRLPGARGEILRRVADVIAARADEIAAALTREEGKPLQRARAEVQRCAEVFRYFAAEVVRYGGLVVPSDRPDVELETRVEPLGPVLVITPFNFPLFVTALKMGAALAAGNTVVWKPSPHVPRTSIALMKGLESAGLPAGVVNLVLGSRPRLGQSLVDDPAIRAISFTGSTKVGLEIGVRAASRHVRIQQEMGGKNVLVIGPDVDLAVAAQIACESAFGESGQKCTAAGVIVVDRARAEPFLRQVATILSRMSMGDGARDGVDLGPLIDAGARDRAQTLLDKAVATGARVEVEGCQLADPDPSGHFFAPRVVTLPDGPNVLATEEAFAPIMPVLVAGDVVEAGLGAIRATGLGLSASILTNRLDLARAFVRRAEAGLVNVNLPTSGVEHQAPFGGWNLSGGPFPEAGSNALDFFTRRKTVAMSSDWITR